MPRSSRSRARRAPDRFAGHDRRAARPGDRGRAGTRALGGALRHLARAARRDVGIGRVPLAEPAARPRPVWLVRLGFCCVPSRAVMPTSIARAPVACAGRRALRRMGRHHLGAARRPSATRTRRPPRARGKQRGECAEPRRGGRAWKRLRAADDRDRRLRLPGQPLQPRLRQRARGLRGQPRRRSAATCTAAGAPTTIRSTVNQLGHPYQGSMYHGFARSAGFNYWESAGYTFAGSAILGDRRRDDAAVAQRPGRERHRRHLPRRGAVPDVEPAARAGRRHAAPSGASRRRR